MDPKDGGWLIRSVLLALTEVLCTPIDTARFAREVEIGHTIRDGVWIPEVDVQSLRRFIATVENPVTHRLFKQPHYRTVEKVCKKLTDAIRVARATQEPDDHDDDPPRPSGKKTTSESNMNTNPGSSAQESNAPGNDNALDQLERDLAIALAELASDVWSDSDEQQAELPALKLSLPEGTSGVGHGGVKVCGLRRARKWSARVGGLAAATLALAVLHYKFEPAFFGWLRNRELAGNIRRANEVTASRHADNQSFAEATVQAQWHASSGNTRVATALHGDSFSAENDFSSGYPVPPAAIALDHRGAATSVTGLSDGSHVKAFVLGSTKSGKSSLVQELLRSSNAWKVDLNETLRTAIAPASDWRSICSTGGVRSQRSEEFVDSRRFRHPLALHLNLEDNLRLDLVYRFSQSDQFLYTADGFHFQLPGAWPNATTTRNLLSCDEIHFALNVVEDWRVKEIYWGDFTDYTDWRDTEIAVLIRAASSWQDGGSTVFTTDPSEWRYTVDVPWHGQGWNVFATVPVNRIGGGASLDGFGACVQGGILIADNSELFARWDRMFFGKESAGGPNFNFLASGVNFYISPESQTHKLSSAVVWALNNTAPLSGTTSNQERDGNEGRNGRLGDPKSGEWSLIGQMQIVY
jgi:hypothetical protein